MGIRVGTERVLRLMRQHGIKARTKRKFVVTADSKHKLPVAPDLVQRKFNPELWSGDITYVATDEAWVYLAGGMATVTRRGDLQHSADRLAPLVGISMLVDESVQDLSLWSSSAWAEKALASLKILLAWRSSLFLRPRALMRSRSMT